MKASPHFFRRLQVAVCLDSSPGSGKLKRSGVAPCEDLLEDETSARSKHAYEFRVQSCLVGDIHRGLLHPHPIKAGRPEGNLCCVAHKYPYPAGIAKQRSQARIHGAEFALEIEADDRGFCVLRKESGCTANAGSQVKHVVRFSG